MRDFFRQAAHAASNVVGSAGAFGVAFIAVLLWAAAGPLYGFSDTWQLAINTTTTIVTFLVVFLVQNTQNRDAKVMHLKLDELIRASRGARDQLLDLEDLPDEEIRKLEYEFRRLHERAVARLAGGGRKHS